eukprot:TRINITY_DN81924_c0_g1_i1.p1 TRINITY_DN81924_c0_g1~~TRINITY_DN81924_c0_g1_i1.p1  ORF type:complete len:546 (+),score=80.56 TRINITY_DN81924_c0_g1_i1:107-1744(+)
MALLPSVLAKLKERGVTFDSSRGNGKLGAEKIVHVPLEADKIVFAAKREWSWEREVEALRELQGHPNIIKIIDFIEPEEGWASFRAASHGPILIQERLKPFRCDLFELVAKNSVTGHKVLPFELILFFTREIVQGIVHMHGKGFVHCDLKAENVLVSVNQEVKIIDFGGARKFGETYNQSYDYGPPDAEIGRTVDKGVDMWGLGNILLFSFTWRTIKGKLEARRLCQTRPLSEDRGLRVSSSHWQVQLQPEAEEILSGLLRPLGRTKLQTETEETERWSCTDVMNWIARNELPGNAQAAESLWPKEEKPDDFCLFQKMKLRLPLQGYAFKIGRDSKLKNKFIGPHGDLKFPHKDILNLGRHGIQVLFIHKASERRTFVAMPEHKVEEGDWLYVGLAPGAEDNEASFSADRAASEEDHSALRFFPTVDGFMFPDACHGKVLGPSDIASGKEGLDVRRKYRFTVAGIKRTNLEGEEEVIFPATAATEVHKGDYCLVCRMPELESGRSRSVLSDGVVHDFLLQEGAVRNAQSAFGSGYSTFTSDELLM